MVKDFKAEFGRRLRQRRIDCKFPSGKSLAEKVGITPQTLNYYENGKNLPDAQTLNDLANALNCTVDYLVLREDAPTHDAASIVEQTGLSAGAVQVLQKLSFDNQYDPEKNNLGDSIIADMQLDFISRLISHMGKSELAESVAEWVHTVLRIKEYEAMSDTKKVLEMYKKYPEDKYLRSREKGLRYEIAHEMEKVLDITQNEMDSRGHTRDGQKSKEANDGKGKD